MHGTSAKITCLKLFLALNSSYLIPFLACRRHKIQFGTQFYGNTGGICGQISGRNTSLLQEQMGIV